MKHIIPRATADRAWRQAKSGAAFAPSIAALVLACTLPASAQQPGGTPEASNMVLLGAHDLQARSAYQPLIREQNGRWILYVGHHGGTESAPKPVNALTGAAEFNGTSVVDVTDPRAPRYLAHIPGEEGQAESGGAQMVRVCSGKELPRGDNAGVRAVDIRDPYHPREIAYYIPAVTARTEPRCVKVNGADRCKIAIQTNNVEVDDRGYIYIVDRANTGVHILELSGAARQIANLPR